MEVDSIIHGITEQTPNISDVHIALVVTKFVSAPNNLSPSQGQEFSTARSKS